MQCRRPAPNVKYVSPFTLAEFAFSVENLIIRKQFKNLIKSYKKTLLRIIILISNKKKLFKQAIFNWKIVRIHVTFVIACYNCIIKMHEKNTKLQEK